MKTFIIVNPAAGEGQAEKRWKKFENNLIKNKILYHVVITEYKNHATKLVSDAILSGYNRIGVFSGDGTLNEVIQGMFKDDQILANNLKLIFFPAGSSCDFEKKFEHHRNFIQRIEADDTKSIDVFKIKCHDFSGKQISRYIINNSSIGIISLANEKFNSVQGITKKIKQMSVDAGAVFVAYRPFWNSIRSMLTCYWMVKLYP